MINLILKLIRTIRIGDEKMSASTDALTAAVQANTTATNNLTVALSKPADISVVDAATTQITANTAAIVAATPTV